MDSKPKILGSIPNILAKMEKSTEIGICIVLKTIHRSKGGVSVRSRPSPPNKNAEIAQSVEQRTENPCVGGSIPPFSTIKWIVRIVRYCIPLLRERGKTLIGSNPILSTILIYNNGEVINTNGRCADCKSVSFMDSWFESRSLHH